MTAQLTPHELETLRVAKEAGNYVAYYTWLESYGEAYGALAKDVAGSQSLSGRIARAYASAVAKEKYHVTLTPVQWGQISIALMEQDFAIRETLADLQNPQFSSIDLNANAIRTYRSILTANDNDFGWSERACGIFGGVDAGGAA